MKAFNYSLLALMIVVLVIVLASCGATPIEVVDPLLVGSWYGECGLSLPIVFNPNELPDSVERTQQAVALTVIIHEDAVVDGTIGEATLQDSVLKQNRGELGRRLNIASDYIIINGYLSGPIVPGQDDNELKSFTIPFDLADEKIQGGLMWRQEWRYPYPLCKVVMEQQ
jgi:hypothetical protein